MTHGFSSLGLQHIVIVLCPSSPEAQVAVSAAVPSWCQQAVPPSAVGIRLLERLTKTMLSCLPYSPFISAAKNSMCINCPPPASSTSQGNSTFNGQPTVLMPLIPFNVTQSWGYTPSEPWGSEPVQGLQSGGVGECQETLGAFSKSCPPWSLCLWLQRLCHGQAMRRSGRADLSDTLKGEHYPGVQTELCKKLIYYRIDLLTWSLNTVIFISVRCVSGWVLTSVCSHITPAAISG